MTFTLTCAVTSLWIFTGTVTSPSALSGSASTILRLSMAKPLASSACAMSDERFGLLLLLSFLHLGDLALALDLAFVRFSDRQRQLARQQIVAGIAVGDLHDITAAAEIVDVFTKNDFHMRGLERVSR
jgi:hypothetical protein